MQIGIPKEIKNHEYRVGATPAMVRSFVKAGHKVVVQSLAGSKIGFSDQAYQQAGALIVKTAQGVYESELIVKVKEPQEEEFDLLREGQILFCYLHLAPDPIQTKRLLEKKVIGIAYETVTDSYGRLPLLAPMSEIAGRIAVQVGATTLQMANGGKGILLGGIPGVLPGRVLILGGGVVGTESAKMAMGLGAEVTVIDRNIHRLRELDALFGPRLKTLYSTPDGIENVIGEADLVIGAVLIPGKKAPKMIRKEHLAKMSPGSVLVDVSIDQGGCFETSYPTTHSDPTYEVDGIVHYCVTNMPGACARTATLGLTNATFDYAMKIANQGYKQALREDRHLRDGLNVALGQVTNEAVAFELGYSYTSPTELL